MSRYSYVVNSTAPWSFRLSNGSYIDTHNEAFEQYDVMVLATGSEPIFTMTNQ